MNKDIEAFKINEQCKLIDALKIMDKNKTKLLIVSKDDYYINLLSVGDVQRAIINNVGLDEIVKNIKIDKKVIAYETQTKEEVKEVLESIRSSFIPVVDADHKIKHVYFWEDLFDQGRKQSKKHISNTVVIMAGGQGTRLKPITNIIPKPLIPIGNDTIIENIIDRFRKVGCNDFFISVNFKSDLIKQYLTSKIDYGKIKYYNETMPLGTGGSLSLMKKDIKDTFFVTNCDILIDEDYSEILEYHRSNNNKITVVVALKHIKIPYGTVVSGDNGLLLEMNEKPEFTMKVNTGLYVLEPELLNDIPENQFFHITELIKEVKERGDRVGVFPVSEQSWLDIGEWPEYIRTVRSISGDINHFKGI